MLILIAAMLCFCGFPKKPFFAAAKCIPVFGPMKYKIIEERRKKLANL